MQYNLLVYEYEDHSEFRTLEIDGEFWFVAIDVCRALDIKNPSDAYARLDADDLGTTEALDKRGSKQSLRIVSEPGLYALIFQSRRPEAARFKRWVTHEVLPSIRKTGSYRAGGIPAFIRRYNANWDRVSAGYFSIISELAIRLWGRFEQVGYIMADTATDGREMRPDVSVGRVFSDWLKRKHPKVADNFTEYYHWTPQGEFPARQYPLEMLPLYLEFIDTVWLPEYSEPYFRARDPKALAFLPKLLPGGTRARPALPSRPGLRPLPKYAPRPSPTAPR